MAPGVRLGRLLELAHARSGHRATVLVDEYDKPLLDAMENAVLLERNRAALKAFYSVLKSADEHLRFFFVTGVTKCTRWGPTVPESVHAGGVVCRVHLPSCQMRFQQGLNEKPVPCSKGAAPTCRGNVKRGLAPFDKAPFDKNPFASAPGGGGVCALPLCHNESGRTAGRRPECHCLIKNAPWRH